VVAVAFGEHRHAGHECKGSGEVGENEVTM
jgi:hypothetical protein